MTAMRPLAQLALATALALGTLSMTADAQPVAEAEETQQ